MGIDVEFFKRLQEKNEEIIEAANRQTILSQRSEVTGAFQTFGDGTVADLPAAGTTRRVAYVTDGRKPGEGAGAGTGVPVFDDGTAWRSFCDGATVAA